MTTRHTRAFRVTCAGLLAGVEGPVAVLVAETKIAGPGRVKPKARYVYLPYAERMAIQQMAWDTCPGRDVAAPHRLQPHRGPVMLRGYAIDAETGTSPDEISAFDPTRSGERGWTNAEGAWVNVDALAEVFLWVLQDYQGKHGDKASYNQRALLACRMMATAAGGYAVGGYAVTADGRVLHNDHSAPDPEKT